MQKCVETLYAFLQNLKKKNVWNCYTSELILVKDTSLSADADVSTTA